MSVLHSVIFNFFKVEVMFEFTLEYFGNHLQVSYVLGVYKEILDIEVV